MIVVNNKQRKLENIKKKYPNAKIIDVTSKGAEPYVKFSPFYPIGNIPIPFSEHQFSASVEGIWQGLKVFENHDIDAKKFEVTTMKGLKRTVRKFGFPKGHRKGVNGEVLLDYITARKQIYLPIYKWILENKLQEEVASLKELSQEQDLVLLDYETNGDVENPKKPLSHAYLLKYHLEGVL